MKRRVLVAIAVLCGACRAIVGPDPSTNSAAMFDQVWKDVDLHYPFFDVKHINWDSLGAAYRPLALAAEDDGALAGAFRNCLAACTISTSCSTTHQPPGRRIRICLTRQLLTQST